MLAAEDGGGVRGAKRAQERAHSRLFWAFAGPLGPYLPHGLTPMGNAALALSPVIFLLSRAGAERRAEAGREEEERTWRRT